MKCLDPKDLELGHRQLYAAVLKEIESYAARDSLIADLGCGKGVILDYLARKGFNVLGFDLFPQGYCLSPALKKRVKKDDILSAKFGGKFDVIILTEVIEHFPKYEPFLKKAHSLLAPGGTAFVSVPNNWEFRFIKCPCCNEIVPANGHNWRFNKKIFADNLSKSFAEFSVKEVAERKWLLGIASGNPSVKGKFRLSHYTDDLRYKAAKTFGNHFF